MKYQYNNNCTVVSVNAVKDKVSGVAELDGIIYVVCHGSKSIKSFVVNNANPRQRSRPIVVDALHDACDLVACLHTRRLYVADQQGLWVVSPTAHDKVSVDLTVA